MTKLNEYAVPGQDQGGEKPLPPGWRQISLDQILSPDQFRQVKRLDKQNRDPEDFLKALKQYFETIRADLETKGVDAGYLAYALYARRLGVI